MRHARTHLRALIATVAALVAVAATAIAASGCGSGSAAIDPVAQAADFTSHAGGTHMTIAASVSGEEELPSSFSVQGSGFFNYRTREGEIVMTMSGLPSSSELPGGELHMEELYTRSAIYVGSPLFAGKLPGGARWMKLDLSQVSQALGISPEQLGANQSNPAQTLEYLKASGGSVTTVGHEDVHGVPTTRYRGAIDLSKAAEVLPTNDREQVRKSFAKVIEELGTSSLPVEVWVDDHRYVRRIDMDMPLPSTAGGSAHAQMDMTLEFSSFEPTPAVTPPPDNEVFDATSSALNDLKAG
jgi:hypothetical protein